MKNSIFLMAGLFLFACGTKKSATTDGSSQFTEIKAIVSAQEVPDQAATIDNVKVKGNFMTMDVTFANACPNDQVIVVGRPELMKSMPPIRNVAVARTKGSGECTDFITKRVRVDISDLAYEKTSGSVIMLQFEGVRDKVKYTYE